MTGWECLRQLFILRFKYGKTPQQKVGDKRPPPRPTIGPWKKHIIFFKLSYLEHLVLRYCLDVMHIEKNVTESLVATLLGIVGKSKDNLNARLDLELMGMKPELQRKFVNGKPKMHPGAYTMKPLENELFCKQFLPIAIRKSLPAGTAHILLELSAFFRHLCTKKGLHLTIHLAEEAAHAGPVHYRWMYLIERYMLTLKKYVRNKNRHEGSMTQGYLAEECLSFCAMYLEGVETRLNRPSQNVDRIRPDYEVDIDIFCATGHSLEVMWRMLKELEGVLQAKKEAIKSFPYWFEKHVN
ncbi:hypothetical protein ACFX12_018897 [Malus domestica]